ncbi:MAG TPA: transporter substrate-binding domain-containing protein [Burkholderiaceae bacterium]
MRISPSITLLILAFALGAAGVGRAQPVCTKVVVTADPEFPPFAWYDGKSLRGASVDVVLAVLDAIKLPYELRYVGPFPRVLLRAEEGDVDIITELKRTPERMAYLAYAETPIFTNPSAVYVRAEREMAVRTREDLRGLVGGVTRGTRFGDGLDEYIEASLQVQVASGIKENFAKLEARRIDYFLSPYYPAQLHLLAAGEEAKFRALKPFVAEALNYVGWSRRSACLGRLAEFDAMLKRYLQASGRERLVNEGNIAWRRSPVMVR